MNSSHPNIKILVACHKADPNIQHDDVYMPIQVGKALHPEVNLGFQCDNTGDNISDKNESYCELTALYWAWKNLKNVDYIGLCHYRRYFDFANIGKKRDLIAFSREADSIDLDINRITDLLIPETVIVSSPLLYPYSLKTDYCINHIKEDFDILENVIKKDFPQYYPAFDRVINQGNKASLCNMFIMSWDNFDKYCKWLFAVLDKVETGVKLSPYPYQRRVFGFMAERLLNVYIHGILSNIVFCPIVMIDSSRHNPIMITSTQKAKINFKALVSGCRF